MRIVVVSGIWPPDVGGPASHAPELAAWLAARGHSVEVVTTAVVAPAAERYPVRFISRRLPPGLRHAAVARVIAVRARHADVVYATSMVGRTSVAAALAGRPYVAKIASDPVFERARRRGLVTGGLEGFRVERGGLVVRALTWGRDWSLRRAAAVTCPSSFMRDRVVAWGADPQRVFVLPNPAPSADEAASFELRADPPLVVFTGRLTPQKELGVAFGALGMVPQATLAIAGDGEERARLEADAARLGVADRVRFLGALPRPQVLGLLRAADVAVLSSAWENFPHAAVEALAMGTPVIATRVGGVPEIVRDGENGLLVEPGSPDALGAALRRYLADEGMRGRMRTAAAPSVERFSADAVYGQLERILEGAAR